MHSEIIFRDTGRVDEILKLFEHHLGDNITSVRTNCGEGYVTVGVQYASDEKFADKHMTCVARAHVRSIQDQAYDKDGNIKQEMRCSTPNFRIHQAI